MKIIEDTISIDELSQMAGDMFGDMVKAVVDVEKPGIGRRRFHRIRFDDQPAPVARESKPGGRPYGNTGEDPGDRPADDRPMNFRHGQLAAGRWNELSFFEQMANIGSEVERTIKWKNRGNDRSANNAFERALELFDLTVEDGKNRERLSEISRCREAFSDYIAGDNFFRSTDLQWRKYFFAFQYAVQSKKRT